MSQGGVCMEGGRRAADLPRPLPSPRPGAARGRPFPAGPPAPLATGTRRSPGGGRPPVPRPGPQGCCASPRRPPRESLLSAVPGLRACVPAGPGLPGALGASRGCGLCGAGLAAGRVGVGIRCWAVEALSARRGSLALRAAARTRLPRTGFGLGSRSPLPYVCGVLAWW